MIEDPRAARTCRSLRSVTLLAGVIVGSMTACSDGAHELQLLRRDALGPTHLTANPLTGTPSFLRTQLPVTLVGDPGTGETVGHAFMKRYGELFGLDDGLRELRHVSDETGPRGMRHVTFQQVHRGVEVYGAEISVHLSGDGDRVVAVTNSVVPDVRVSITTPRIDADSATRVARTYLPGGTVESSSLVVYPGVGRRSPARLAWLVELRDDGVPARRAYAVSARNGRVLDVLDRLYIARDRATYSANNGAMLPGTLRRSEGIGPVGDRDVDNAHDFAGETYDYFAETHGRDSYDDKGATLTSTARYRSGFQNAFWNGRQMVYGDGYTVRDVVAHELTHAVTEHSAKLEYRWQSGALNESYSDIFASMVDRGDWLVGEDLPNGPIRNMADPEQFNHPGHTRDWRAMCNDNEGVHINSGIHNKAYVTVAEAIGKDSAERIFYRALTVYVKSQASFEDSRSAALQSATDIFGEKSAEFEAVDRGFAAVGIDGSFDPGPGGCGGGGSDRNDSLVGILTALALFLGVGGLFRAIRRV